MAAINDRTRLTGLLALFYLLKTIFESIAVILRLILNSSKYSGALNIVRRVDLSGVAKRNIILLAEKSFKCKKMKM